MESSSVIRGRRRSIRAYKPDEVPELVTWVS